MYKNLEAEMKRNDIKRADIAKLLGISIAGVSERLSKPQRLKLCEAIKIKNTFFPTMDMEYLFNETKSA